MDIEKNRNAKIIVRYTKSFSIPLLERYTPADPPKTDPRPDPLDCKSIRIIRVMEIDSCKINKSVFI